MVFFFPIGHEESTVRRWPVVTIAIIVICLVAHAVVFPVIRKQEREREQILDRIELLKMQVYVKNAMPSAGGFLDLMDRVNSANLLDMVVGVEAQVEQYWEEFRRGRATDPDDPDLLRYEALAATLQEADEASILHRFGFWPRRSAPHTYITAMFLHGGLLHLFGNLYFLYLVGGSIEDRWGRVFFPLFYLAGGVVAFGVESLAFRGDPRPFVGASGAIAAVMGAFAVRFWRVRVHFWYFYLLIRLHRGTVMLPAYFVLSIWFLYQLVMGLLLREHVSVALLGHAGGFAFGALAAGVVQITGFERRFMAPAIEQKLETPVRHTDQRLVRARDLLVRDEAGPALELLYQVQAENPGNLLVKKEILRALLAQGRESDVRAEGRDVVERLVAEEQEGEAAEVFRDIVAVVGDFAAGQKEQYRVARHLERGRDFENAARAYANLADRWPESPLAPKALANAARLAWERLDDPRIAYKRYRRFLERYPDSPLAEHVRGAVTKITGGQAVFD